MTSKNIDPADLVPLNIYRNEPITIDVVYAQADHPDNHFPETYSAETKIMWAHKDLAPLTIVAARLCHKLYGWTLKINDCLRTVEAQEKMLTYGYHPGLVSVPGTGAHPRAMAIDVEPIAMDGKAVDMGTPFDSFVDDPINDPNPAGRDFVDFSEDDDINQIIWTNRAHLEFVMRRAAFLTDTPLWCLPQEWWDFRLPPEISDQYAPLYEKDLFPYQRLRNPDTKQADQILAGHIPEELQKTLKKVNETLEKIKI